MRSLSSTTPRPIRRRNFSPATATGSAWSRTQPTAGSAPAVNDGAAAASGEFLVFLNNDTSPQPGWLEALVRYAYGHPRAAAVGSKLLFPNGTIQHAGVILRPNGEPAHIYAGFPA